MASIIFAAIISIGLPLTALLYACSKKRYIPFVLGGLAFVVSQVLIRVPIIKYLGEHSTAYSMFSAMQPVLFAIVIGLTAGIFEELARFIAMRFFMKQRDWQSGFLFGAGHGGIEAVLFLGSSAVFLLFSPTAIANSDTYFIGGIERFFAMLLHIGLSIIVLQGVVRKRFLYVVLAIMIHGIVDALVGILPLYVPKESSLLIVEVTLAVIAVAVFNYSLWIKRKGVLR
ncbi:YhfC family glutamic-type intramembrane protease [Bacillus sp. S14(2024)]|uniref:YhfC family glutamic-type intramembrane protease n=1 Tax=Bacillus sp. S14(2024) TaxID=3162884 RepID=UPI003D1953DA